MEQRVAVVSAGDSGIGLATSRKLAGEGAHVYISTRHRDRGERTAAELREAGLAAAVLEVDVTVPSSVADAFATLKRVDVLVNSAGTHSYRALGDMTVDDVTYVIEPSLVGTMLMCQQAVPLMPPGGRIVNVASLSIFGGHRVAHYAAAKAAVCGLTRALAVELASRNIGVNAVVPSLLDTPLTRRSLSAGQIRAAAEHAPRGHLVTPDEVADAIAFLGSSRASAITGQFLVVDGGASLPR